MFGIEDLVHSHPAAAWCVLLGAFGLLAKSADVFVDDSVALANRLGIPTLVIGIVLVSLATTAPELSVSLIAAIQGSPEMALGNAVGSVICNAGLGLALCGLFASAPVAIIAHVLKTSGLFLLFVAILAFVFVLPDHALARWEGSILVLLFGVYVASLFVLHKQGKFKDALPAADTPVSRSVPFPRLIAGFGFALVGIIVASKLVVTSAQAIAASFHVPETIVALTVVALGTSIPEVATCITAAKKGHGALAVGNILGANIMNICWVAGASAVANPLIIERKGVLFMFPAMLTIVVTMLVLLGTGHKLTRKDGLILLGLYAGYLVVSVLLYPPG